jgi:hypothetical protein
MIVVADRTSGIVSFFDQAGQVRRTVGGIGSGPGEFRELSWMGTCFATSFVAYDIRELRFTRFNHGSSPELIRRSPVGFVLLRPLSCLRDGSVVAIFDAPKPVAAESGIDRPQGILVRIHADFAAADTLAVFPGQELHVAKEVGGFGELPLGRAGLAAAGKNIAVLAQSDSNWISIHSLSDGLPPRRVNLNLPGRRVTRREFLRAVNARVATEARRETRELLTRVYASASTPSGSRFLRQVAVDGSDRIWIETYAADQRGRSWWEVLDRQGRSVGRVAIPAGATILDASERAVLLRLQRENEPDAVYLYRLVR